ncbi:MAG TPA: GGDEF domain-containing protein, partial [Marinagarivorans sp.]
MKAHTSWTLWQIMTPKQTAPIWATTRQPLTRVLHIVEDPRTAFWFFRSLHKQAQAQCSLTSISHIQQAAEKLHSQHFDAIFIHIGSHTHQHIGDINRLKEWAEHAALVAILHTDDEPSKGHNSNLKSAGHPHSTQQKHSDSQQVDQLLEAGIDDYIKAQDINTPLLPRLVSYAVERKQAHIRLAAMSQQDTITRLATRVEFVHALDAQLITAYGSVRNTAVLIIDLDQFKSINDDRGHTTGDKLLRAVANRLKKSLRQSDAIARLGGDEFAVMLTDMPNIESIQRVASNLLESLNQVFTIGADTLFTTASIGISLLSQKNETSEALLKHANMAMASAKQQGGNRYAFFTRNLQVAASLRVSLETELSKAIANKEF